MARPRRAFFDAARHYRDSGFSPVDAIIQAADDTNSVRVAHWIKIEGFLRVLEKREPQPKRAARRHLVVVK